MAVVSSPPFCATGLILITFTNMRCCINRASPDPWNADSRLIVNPAITRVTFTNNTFTKSDCPDGRPLALLILIKSAAVNYEKRQVLRSTWANRSYLSCLEEPIEFAFLIGTGQFQSAGRVPEQLTNEARVHKDMIWIDYNETYRNNTYKTVAGMKWAVKHCPHFEFAVTVDDDMYLSVQNVLRFLRNPTVYLKVGSGVEGTTQFSRFGFQIDPNELFYGGAVFGGDVNLPNRKGHVALSQLHTPFKIHKEYCYCFRRRLGQVRNLIQRVPLHQISRICVRRCSYLFSAGYEIHLRCSSICQVFEH